MVSNFLPVLTAFATEPEVRLTAVGGEFVPEFASFGGSSAIAALADLHYDVVFMSVTAVSDGACFHPSRATADLKRAFLGSAELRVLLADHTKFTRRAVHRIGNLTEFDVVVVDAETDPADLDAVRAAGVDLVVAQEAHP